MGFSTLPLTPKLNHSTSKAQLPHPSESISEVNRIPFTIYIPQFSDGPQLKQ